MTQPLWLTLETDPPVAFYREPAARPYLDAPRAYQSLVSLGTLRRALSRPGEAESEVPSLSARLDNASGAVTALFGDDWPLHVVARVMSPAGEVFRGLVSRINLGAQATMSIEAGGARALASPVPLRSSTVWGEYGDPTWLPWVYGRATLAPVQYSQDRRAWLVADHAIQGVDRVTRDDVATAAWGWRNTTDSTGRAIALVEMAEPLADGERLAVTLRGRMHATTGALLEGRADVLGDILVNLCGLPESLATAWAWSEDNGLRLGGVIADGEQSARAVVDTVLRAAGGAWSVAMPEVAIPWPPVDDGEAARAEYGVLDAREVTAEADAGGLATVLRLLFDYDWAAGKHRRALVIEAPDAIERYGRIEREIDAGWLHSQRHADALARAWLARLARPLVTVQWSAPVVDDITPGAWVDLDHPHNPLAGRRRLTQADIDMDRAEMHLAIADPVGPEPRLSEPRLASLMDAYVQAGAAVVYQDGAATFTILDDAGLPMPGATVTLDGGAAKRLTDAAGHVAFTATRGAHVLHVRASGYADMEIEVTL